eukprot:gene4334-biopygen3518
MAELVSANAHNEEAKSQNSCNLSERDKWIINWLSKNLVSQEGSKVEVAVLVHKVQQELGEPVSSNVVEPGARFDDSVEGQNSGQSGDSTKTQSQALNYRKAINLYRNERLEKEKLQKNLDRERELSKYSKSLQLPSSMFLKVEELLEVPSSKKYSGTFGCCSLFSYRGMDVAVKAYKESEAFTDDALKQSLLKEANVLLNLHCHRGIPKLLGVVMEIKPYCLVTSFHGLNRESSTVNAILKTGASCLIPGMPKGKEDWFKILCSLGDALLHIHTTGYVHGDIKTDNVLVEEGLVAVITDFGKSVLATRSKINNIPLSERDEYCKKYPWVAPEVIHGKTALTRASDIFAFGYLTKKVAKTCGLKSKRMDDIISNTLTPDPDKRICLTRIQSRLSGYF